MTPTQFRGGAADVSDSTFSGTKLTNNATSYLNSIVKKSFNGTEPESGATSGNKKSRI